MKVLHGHSHSRNRNLVSRPLLSAINLIVPATMRGRILFQIGIVIFLLVLLNLMGVYLGIWVPANTENYRGIIPYYFSNLKEDISLLKWSRAPNSHNMLEDCLKSKDVIQSNIILKPGDETLFLYLETAVNSERLLLNDLLKRLSIESKALQLNFKDEKTLQSGLELVSSFSNHHPIIIHATVLKSSHDTCKSCNIIDGGQFIKTFLQHTPGQWIMSLSWSSFNENTEYTWKDGIFMLNTILAWKKDPKENNFDIMIPVRASKVSHNSARMLIWLLHRSSASLKIYSEPTDSNAFSNGVFLLLKALPKSILYFDFPQLNIHEQNDLTSMRLSVLKLQPSSSLLKFWYKDWSAFCGLLSCGLFRGGFVFASQGATMKYKHSLKIVNNLVISGRVQFWNQLSVDQPRCQLKFCLLPSGHSICNSPIFLLSSNGELKSQISSGELPSQLKSSTNAFIFEMTFSLNQKSSFHARALYSVDDSKNYLADPLSVPANFHIIATHEYEFVINIDCAENSMGVIDQLTVNQH